MAKNPNDPRLDGETSPMTSKMTVTVLDSHGKAVGKTYPKRAKGLVKKGRAEALTGDVIRLRDFRPHDATEEITMDNKINTGIITENTPKHIAFEPRDWYPNPQNNSRANLCERTMHTFPNGGCEEIFSISSFSGNHSEIISRLIPVEIGGEYSFTFWLNGGENDRGDEVCRLSVIYTDFDGAENSGRSDGELPQDDLHRKYTYLLNRGKTPFLKEVDGWYLFEIKLPKPDKKYLELRFDATNAPTAIRRAKAAAEYANTENRPDPYAQYRPQRHNIEFKDGWPEDKPGVFGREYSTEAIKRRLDEEKAREKARLEAHEQEKAKWKKMIEEAVESAKKSGNNSGKIVINGVEIPDFSDINIDETAEKLANDTDLSRGDADKNSFDMMKRRLKALKSFKDSDVHFNINGTEFFLSDLGEIADESDAVAGITEALEKIRPFAEKNYSFNNVSMAGVEKFLEAAAAEFEKGNDGIGYDLLKDVCRLSRPAKCNNSTVNGVRICDVISDLDLLLGRLKSERKSKASGAAANENPGIDFDSLPDSIDLGNLAGNIDLDDLADRIDLDDLAESIDLEELAENIDLDDLAANLAENIDLDDLADRIDLEELAENIDLDDLAANLAENLDYDDLGERVADNINMDSLAEGLADNIYMEDLAEKLSKKLDFSELAEAVADQIDLDGLAELIAEKIDLKGLIRDMLDE